MELAQFNRTVDVYLETVPIKGATTWCMARTMLFCSNKHPKDWNWWKPNPKYPNEDREELKEPVRRRFTKIYAKTRPTPKGINPETGKKYVDNLAPVVIEEYWPLLCDAEDYESPIYRGIGDPPLVVESAKITIQKITNNYLNTNRSLNAFEVTDAISNDKYEVVQITEEADDDELLNW